jgi:hypothetical protein
LLEIAIRSKHLIRFRRDRPLAVILFASIILQRISSLLAHRDISRRPSNSVAFGAKRTFSEPRLPTRIYEYTP